ncbi:DUF402 domain-containing protein [Streptomyces sp. WAC 06738]|uniref:DUF402 domain-containing protein n=1 Tax=Streptomyces sp. WAC 06738 TaxID=2203210 RepID=UPI000F6FB7A8|nr:DUF402 domain-containing protein [Streptomyces sp. WAC 06738]AZM44762.1 DUF402 domain-containing protein [Streptomyces sp. WAC 06738]
MLTPGREVEVTLIKQLRPGLSYPAVVVRDDGNHAVVRAPWAGPKERDAGYVRFEQGDVWTEHFWRDRWYSVKEIRAADGRIKGWYCDVARPARVEEDRVTVHDLELDLWLSGDRQTLLRLDEDEFVASGLPERDPGTAARARAALDELEELARTGLDELLAA